MLFLFRYAGAIGLNYTVSLFQNISESKNIKQFVHALTLFKDLIYFPRGFYHIGKLLPTNNLCL